MTGVPTWDELLELNRATVGRSIHAVAHDAGNTFHGWTLQRIWFAPQDRWRVEDADGAVQRVKDDQFAYRRLDGRMHRHRARPWAPGDLVYPRLEPPNEMLVAHRRWPAPTPPSRRPTEPPATPADVSATDTTFVPVTGNSTAPPAMLAAFEPSGPAEKAIVRGRAGWTVACMMPTVSQHPVAVTLTFDAETGVVIGRNVGQRYNTTELSDVVLDEPFDPALFRWTGDYIDADAIDAQRRAQYAAHQSMLEQIPTCTPTAWPRPELETDVREGDPDSWALRVALYDLTGFDGEITRWRRGTPRPFPAATERYPHTHLWSDHYWDYALDTNQPVPDSEAYLIERSTPVVVPPDTAPGNPKHNSHA